MICKKEWSNNEFISNNITFEYIISMKSFEFETLKSERMEKIL